MASTASGWQYAVPNDTLVAWPAVSQAVADKLEISLPKSAGLQLVKTQTIGAGVSSVAITNAFSATYENYKIVVSGGVSSSNGTINLQFTGQSTQYYWGMSYTSYGNNTPLGLTNNNAGNFSYIGFANANGLTANVEVNSPFLTKYTTITAGVPAETYAGSTNGVIRANASYTGFSLIHDVGGATFTGGTIYVYGYAKV
jgi:hypothetical protein